MISQQWRADGAGQSLLMGRAPLTHQSRGMPLSNHVITYAVVAVCRERRCCLG